MLVVGVQPLHLQNGWDVEQPLSFQEEDEMDKTGEREAQWRLHVGAWQASGARKRTVSRESNASPPKSPPTQALRATQSPNRERPALVSA